MFTPDPTDLIAEYLFDGRIHPKGGEKWIENSAPPSPAKAEDGRIEDGEFPLGLDQDTPQGMLGKSLNFDTLRKTIGEYGPIDFCMKGRRCETAPSGGYCDKAQYVEVEKFPHCEEITVECWVKVDYIDKRDNPTGGSPFPDKKFGFGACPQPICKECSWYLFLSTAMTDRNLAFAHIPNDVTKGLPKFDDSFGNSTCSPDPNCKGTAPLPCAEPAAQPGHGGVLSASPVEGNQWVHIAAVFAKTSTGARPYRAQVFIDGKEDTALSVEDACSNTLDWSKETDNPIFPGGDTLRLGMFRELINTLDYQFSGKLAGVRIYGRALSADEVRRDYEHDRGLHRRSSLRFGQRIALRSHHGRFLIAEKNGPFHSRARAVGPWELFELVNPNSKGPADQVAQVRFGDEIALHSVHGQHLSATQDGKVEVSSQEIAWVILDPQDQSSTEPVFHDSRIALRSLHGKHLVAEGDHRVNADRTWIRGWETWHLGRHLELWYGDRVALRSAHGKFLVAEPPGNLDADRPKALSWEHFQFVDPNDPSRIGPVCYTDSVALVSAHGKYAVGEDDGKTNANRDAIGTWEKWIVRDPQRPDSGLRIPIGGELALESWRGTFLTGTAGGQAHSAENDVGAEQRWDVVR